MLLFAHAAPSAHNHLEKIFPAPGNTVAPLLFGVLLSLIVISVVLYLRRRD
jgi:hypothetical protein